MQDSLFHKIKQDKAPEILKCIVEIPKGDFNKYELNHELGILELDRVLYGPNFYPVDYLDVPNTWNKYDNDPLDAVLFSTKPLYPGILVEARVVGLMEMIDNKQKDHKVLCVTHKDPRFDKIKDYRDLPEWAIKDLKTFMETYKYAQTGPGTVKVPAVRGKQEAYKFINECLKEYQKKFGRK